MCHPQCGSIACCHDLLLAGSSEVKESHNHRHRQKSHIINAAGTKDATRTRIKVVYVPKNSQGPVSTPPGKFMFIPMKVPMRVAGMASVNMMVSTAKILLVLSVLSTKSVSLKMSTRSWALLRVSQTLLTRS
jgi:hypothetical protein